MAKKMKVQVAPKNELDGIPDFLKVANRPKGKAADMPSPKKVSAPVVAPKQKRFEVPAGMTEEEYEAKKAELDPPKPAKPEKVVKEKKAKRPEAPHGTFKGADWAREEKLDPRHVRRVFRAHKAEIEKLQVKGHKYVFPSEARAALAKLVNEGFASETKKKVAKAKKVEAPKTKAELRKEGEKAVKEFKKKK